MGQVEIYNFLKSKGEWISVDDCAKELNVCKVNFFKKITKIKKFPLLFPNFESRYVIKKVKYVNNGKNIEGKVRTIYYRVSK